MSKTIESQIVVNLDVEGIHCWPECPFEEVAFLRSPHRHIFKIKVLKTVKHNDRDVEIILFKRKIIELLKTSFSRIGTAIDFDSLSCESIAEFILTSVDADMVEVLEDGENGGVVWSK